MTPAINSRKSLEKMMEASKAYCFMSSYVNRHDTQELNLRISCIFTAGRK